MNEISKRMRKTLAGTPLEVACECTDLLDIGANEIDRADARITELETAITVRDTEIARLETDLELARAEVNRLDQRVDGLRSAIEHGQAIRAIDAARGGS